MKNKFCPYKKVCRDMCYGENPCPFAKAFDGLARKIDLNTSCIESLRAENAELKAKLEQSGAI